MWRRYHRSRNWYNSDHGCSYIHLKFYTVWSREFYVPWLGEGRILSESSRSTFGHLSSQNLYGRASRLDGILTHSPSLNYRLHTSANSYKSIWNSDKLRRIKLGCLPCKAYYSITAFLGRKLQLRVHNSNQLKSCSNCWSHRRHHESRRKNVNLY
jgi:hypothetical protein